jgi:hypothetical protein
MNINVLQMDPALLIAGAVIALGLMGLLVEALFSTRREQENVPEISAKPAHSEKIVTAAAGEVRDPIAEHRRFFSTLGSALTANDDSSATLSALQANLSADVFMERMTLAAKSWRPDGFASGARHLSLKADGAPPDMVAEKVLEGYEHLKAGRVKEALESFLAGIESAKSAAATDTSNPWPHAWSGFAWRGLALIAEEAGDTQATLAGLKVAYQSMLNAFEVTAQDVSAAAKAA